MSFIETDEQRALRAAVASLGRRYGYQYYIERARSGERMTELWQEAGKLGFLGVNLPEPYGGGGAGMYELSLVLEELAANGNAFLVGILTKANQVVAVYHHRRRPNAHQRSALDFVYPSCAATGCNSKVGLQSDHRKDWARTKYTVFDLLDRLCAHHHKLKTYHGWQLVTGTGKRAFVPPSDPRHPGRDGAGTARGDPP